MNDTASFPLPVVAVRTRSNTVDARGALRMHPLVPTTGHGYTDLLPHPFTVTTQL